MPLWIITFFLGTCVLPLCSKLPNLYWLSLSIPAFSAWLLFPQKFKKLSLQLLIFSLGFSWVLVYVHWVMSWSLTHDLESKNLLITGYISALPVQKLHRIGFEFQTATIAKMSIKTKLKLSWYADHPPMIAGDKWQLLVRLKRPHGMLNPGGFDTEKHLLVHHIRATGYVVNSDFNQKLESHWYHYPLTRFRQFLINKMEQALISDPVTPVITAFVTGAEDKITQDQWRVMRDTGTSYLVAISGLHIGLVASLVFILVQFLWKFSSSLPLVMPARESGVIAGLIMGFVYGAVSGLSIPTQRALVMLVMFSLTVLLRRYSQSWNAWLWSLFLVLIINPLAILTIGFWLSFMAVLAIIYVSGNRVRQKTSHLHKFWRMQLTVTLALLPLTLLFFQQISLVTLGANFIAMPGVCMIIVPLSLLGVLCLLIPGHFGGWILWCSAKLLQGVWWWLELLANFSHASWHHPIYNWWVLFAAIVGMAILLAPRGFPVKPIGLLYLLPLFFYLPPKPKACEFWVTLLDVGQGLAAVVQTKNHVLLYDTGPKFLEQDAGTSVILPYFQMQNIKSLDVMVVSHGDMDHIGGAESILKTLPVANILTTVPEKVLPYTAYSCFAGQRWQWDGVDFQILFPPKNSQLIGNNASCVLQITSATSSILLPGDVEKVAENLLVKSYGVALKSTVLVAPHHGSATSSTQDLLTAVAPQYVIFSTGYKNRFHFPHKKIITRYISSQATLLNTPQTGAITFKFNNKSDILHLNKYRESQ